MKKIFFFLCLIAVAASANAQRWTIWYGINYSNEMKNGPLYRRHVRDFGVDYAIPVSRWDYTVGAGVNEKGGAYRVKYAQIEGNAGYRFIDTPRGFRVSALAGPFFGIRVDDDRDKWVPLYSPTQPTLFGWQAGLSLKFKPVALKIGYEQALTSYFNKEITTQTVYADGSRVYPTTRPQSLFIRLGVTF